jgi:outer membrane protein TolC
MYCIFGRSFAHTKPSSLRRSLAAVWQFIVVAACCITNPALAADHRVPLTIFEAADIALRSEPGQGELDARSAALQERAVAAGQLPDPTLRLGIANFPINSGGFSTEGMTQAQLGFRQTFPRSRMRSMNALQYEAMAEVQANLADARAIDVLEAARAAWLDAFYWQKAEDVLRESRPLFDNLLSITESMYAVGRKEQSDVLRAELELRRLDDRLIEAARARAAAQGALSQWLGDEAFRPIANKLPGWNKVPGFEVLRSNLAMHPAMGAADADIAARQAHVGVAEERGKAGWALDVGYGFRDGYLPSGEPRSDFVSVAVVVDLPLFKKNRQDRDLAAALSERSAAMSGKERVAADLGSQLSVEYSRWNELTRQMKLYEGDILNLSASRAEAAMLAYQSDAGDFSDVMHGQIDYLNTRLDFLRLQVERAQAYAALANLGGLPQ